MFKKFLEILDNRGSPAKIIDIGCGDGWISLQAAARGHYVWGIDSSPKAIEQANKVAREKELEKKTDFRVGDALNLPYDENAFDAMIDRGLFHHILPDNRLLYFENVDRVLKNGSLVYLSVFSRRNPLGIGQRFEKEDIEELFSPYFKTIDFFRDPLITIAPAHLLHFILQKKTI